MGFFDKFRKNSAESVVGIQLITERGNGFYSWNGNLYKSDVIRSCIRPKTRAIGKLTPTHIRDGKDGIKVNPEPYMRFLLQEPNPLMTGQMLLEKMTNQLEINNNSFALIIRDEYGYPIQIYPIQATGVEALYKTNELHLKFTLTNGLMPTFAYKDIIHIRQDFAENDIFGETPAEVVKSFMEIITVSDQGVVKAIKNSNLIRWLLKFKQSLRPEDVKEQVEKFRENYLNIENGSGGVAAADAKYDAKQVEYNSYVLNAAQTKETTKRVYNFFNTNESIVQSSYNEDQWTAYYEAVLEPLAKQFSEEFTRKLFSRKERGFGNKIIFEASSLQYASMSTKLGLWQMVDRGAMTPNEWRKVLNMGPIEGGDKPLRRKDTGTVGGESSNGDSSTN